MVGFLRSNRAVPQICWIRFPPFGNGVTDGWIVLPAVWPPVARTSSAVNDGRIVGLLPDRSFLSHTSCCYGTLSKYDAIVGAQRVILPAVEPHHGCGKRVRRRDLLRTAAAAAADETTPEDMS
jgi:hypothetical protein